MKKLLFIAVLLGVSVMAIGQGRTSTSILYTMAIPMGNTADYISKTSYRGFSVYFDHYVEDEFSVGFYSGLQTYYEAMGQQSRVHETGTVTGKAYHYINQIPLFLTGKYHFARFASITPHFGLGTGFNITIQTYELGGYQIEDTDWQFGVQPELGLGIELSPSTDFLVNVVYNQGVNSSDIDAMSSVAFNVGLRFVP